MKESKEDEERRIEDFGNWLEQGDEENAEN